MNWTVVCSNSWAAFPITYWSFDYRKNFELRELEWII